MKRIPNVGLTMRLLLLALVTLLGLAAPTPATTRVVLSAAGGSRLIALLG